MAITALGKELRRLRLEKGEVMKDMANAINVSSAYLSAVERGKKSPSDKMITGIKNHYQLSSDEIQSLHEAVVLSQTNISIDLQDSDEEDRMLATAFARKFKGLEEGQKEQISKLLNGV